MTFQEFLQQNNIASVKRTQSGNGVNFLNASGVQLGTVILNQDTPANEDLLQWVKDHMAFNCKVSGNFVTLSKSDAVDITSLFAAPAKTSAPKKVKA